MSHRHALLRAASLIVVANLSSVAVAQVATKVLPAAPVPSKSLPVAGRVVRSFDAAGVERIILRAADAEQAEVTFVPGVRSITVSGIPEGGAAGYHSPDPGWRETPASRWGLDFQARSFGPTMVVSTKSEIRYIHHGYAFTSLAITVPRGVEVVKENRKLTGESAPDMTPPAPR
jgi:hypothetical protein